jgi:hypothetical protein
MNIKASINNVIDDFADACKEASGDLPKEYEAPIEHAQS